MVSISEQDYIIIAATGAPGRLIYILLSFRTQFILHKLIWTSITLCIHNIIKADNWTDSISVQDYKIIVAMAVFLDILYVSCYASGRYLYCTNWYEHQLHCVFRILSKQIAAVSISEQDYITITALAVFPDDSYVSC